MVTDLGTRTDVTESGSGPPVLLVHGQPGLAEDWNAVVELARRDHRVIVPDRPGYGAASGEPTSMAENARMLAELMIERDAVPATVVGHSYGGGIALLLAAQRPDLVTGLVLVGSVGPASGLGAIDHLLANRVVGEAMSAAGLIILGRILPRLRPAARMVPGLPGEWLSAVLPDGRYAAVTDGRTGSEMSLLRAFVREQRAMLEEISTVEEQAARISVPTVVVAGSWDVVVPPSTASWLASNIDRAELVIVDHAGHFIPRDRPDVVVEALSRVEDTGPPGEAAYR